MPRPMPPGWPRHDVTMPDKPKGIEDWPYIYAWQEGVSLDHGRHPAPDPTSTGAVGDGRHLELPSSRPAQPAGDERQEAPPFRLALGVREAARVVGVSHSTISREVAAGRLKAKRYGRRVLIRPRDLRDWLSSLPDARGGKTYAG